MLAVNVNKKRKDLSNEIIETLHHWPELHRNIFIRTHYNGQSTEDVSHALNLDAEDVNRILAHCDRRLYAALRKFRTDRCKKASSFSAVTGRLVVFKQDWKGGVILKEACNHAGN